MDKIERVMAVIEGRRPDRTPVGFWYHFSADQVCGRAAVEAHVAHVETFDLDFLKIMNDNGYPHDGQIRTAADLASLVELRGDEPAFEKQLQLIADLKRRLGGRMLMTTTVFNAWATLRRLVKPPSTHHAPPTMNGSNDAATATLLGFYGQDAAAVATAIQTVATSLGNFARKSVDAGADGVFMSVRDDWVDGGAENGTNYNRLIRQSDLKVLAGAVGGAFNMLHVCGRAIDFRAFAEYPVQVINWADRAAGPAIREVRDWVKPAICAGVDNLDTLGNGTPADCAREVADALDQAADRPMIIGPGCTFDPKAVPQANLKAVVRAARA